MGEIDTKSSDIRDLKFDTVAACLAELDRIQAAHEAGNLSAKGNWTVGQNMAHLAAWIEYGYVGYPMKAPPFFVRWVLKRMFRKLLKAGKMPSGQNIPGVEDGTFGQEEMEALAGIERFRAALMKMQSEPAVHDSPAFGKMSDENRIRLNLMHAQLHLGFLDYAGSSQG